MSGPTDFSEIDLTRFHRIICGLLSTRVPLAVIDTIGDLVWSSDDAPAVKEQFTEAFRQTRKPGVQGFSEPFCHGLGTGNAVVARVLPDRSGECFGWLVVMIDDAATSDLPSRTMLVFEEVAPLISNALQHVQELNTMAIELGDRYEELSLLWVREESGDGHNECRDELSQQVRRCAEQLNVELAALWVEPFDIIFPAGHLYDKADQAQAQLLHDLVEACNQWFRQGYGNLGINLSTDPAWKKLDLLPTRKLVAVPLHDGQGRQSGVLVCTNAIDKRDFSNGDRKLLEVISDAAGKCLARRQDPLTGLNNRQGWTEHVERIRACTDQEGRHKALVLGLLNLSQFRAVNASYGTSAGDQLLRLVARAISKAGEGKVSLARLDADSFSIVFEGADVRHAHAAARAMINEIGAVRLEWDSHLVGIDACVGLVDVASDDEASIDSLLTRAELALDAVKNAQGLSVLVYDENDPRMSGKYQQLNWVSHIKRALDESRFVLYCQKIVALQDGCDHYELLVRMLDDDGGIVRPDIFIGTAERYNLMPAVDRWVISEAARCLAKLKPGSADSMTWGINLSGQTITSPGMLGHIQQSLSAFDIRPDQVYFELTETVAVESFQHCVQFMKEIQALGCKFALDDFGSGLSSFTYLKNLPVDYLKIDGALIRDMATNPIDQSMVTAIAQVANVMGLKTIAEFVEDERTASLLRELQLDYAQGYFFMRPMPLLDEIARLNDGAIEVVNSGGCG